MNEYFNINEINDDSIVYYFEENVPVRLMKAKDIPDEIRNKLSDVLTVIKHQDKYILQTAENKHNLDQLFERAKIFDYLSDIKNWDDYEYWQLKAVYEILRNDQQGTEYFSGDMQITGRGS